jgi:hypothetical protein
MDPNHTVLLAPSLAAQQSHYTSILAPAGLVVTTDLDAWASESQGRVMLLGLEEAALFSDAVKRTQGIRAVFISQDAPVLSEESNLHLAVAPRLKPDAPSEQLVRTIALLSRSSSWLQQRLSSIDKNARSLAASEYCEWVRSRPGIIGWVPLTRIESVPAAEKCFQRLAAHAYSVLDSLPSESLSTEDLWNITLLVAVPLSRPAPDRATDLEQILGSIPNDLRGSRKIVLWFEDDVLNYFGPLRAGYDSWEPSAQDPLRVTLDRLAMDNVERDALELVFKRRLSQQDIDSLTDILSRGYDQTSGH